VQPCKAEEGGFGLDELHKAHLEKEVVPLLPQREEVFSDICSMELEVRFLLMDYFSLQFCLIHNKHQI
jgi:hypothetical protein